MNFIFSILVHLDHIYVTFNIKAEVKVKENCYILPNLYFWVNVIHENLGERNLKINVTGYQGQMKGD